MLPGRLGLATAQIPQRNRHGLMWLGKGNLYVEDGTLRFATAGFDQLKAGDYAVPYQMVSCILLHPGTSLTHDAMRILARHGTGLVAVGTDGVRFYSAMPFGPDRAARARRQAEAWADTDGTRIHIVRKMYAWRMGDVLPVKDLDALRGIEGARVKKCYKQLASDFGIPWRGRRYDRSDPETNDVPNQAINYASSATQGAAMVAVAVTGTIPQLGFIHEHSGISFALDIADLFREQITLPVAFGAARKVIQDSSTDLEREVRYLAGDTFRSEQVVSEMIEKIKLLLDPQE